MASSAARDAAASQRTAPTSLALGSSALAAEKPPAPSPYSDVSTSTLPTPTTCCVVVRFFRARFWTSANSRPRSPSVAVAAAFSEKSSPSRLWSDTAWAWDSKPSAEWAAPPESTSPSDVSAVRVRSMIASSSASLSGRSASVPLTMAWAPNVRLARSSEPVGASPSAASAAAAPSCAAATRAPSRFTMESRYSFFSARWTMRSSTVPAVTRR
mmetsp:Transcript_30749/g.100830  ORF Transcript_30749/g.100830 Transcript_30749/m.100830 type:complete len:213 (+) Transcript_30749:1352-1990(+)